MKIALSCVVLILLLAACAGPTPTQSPVFPSPAATLALESPLDVNALPLGPAFAFVEPVKGGDAEISGSGGPNVPIRIIDITTAGDIIATGIVDKDGKFKLPSMAQVVKGHRLGIMLGEIAGTSFKSEDFVRGPNYDDIPFIGTVFASTLVQ